MRLLSESRVLVYDARMKWVWCDDFVECVSCDCVWSEDNLMMVVIKCRVFEYEVRLILWSCWVIESPVFVYEVRMMWWGCWVSVICLCLKWGWCDEVIEWVSRVYVWSEDDVMSLMSECHVFVFEVRMMGLSCWVSVMCLCMKWGICD